MRWFNRLSVRPWGSPVAPARVALLCGIARVASPRPSRVKSVPATPPFALHRGWQMFTLFCDSEGRRWFPPCGGCPRVGLKRCRRGLFPGRLRDGVFARGRPGKMRGSASGRSRRVLSIAQCFNIGSCPPDFPSLPEGRLTTATRLRAETVANRRFMLRSRKVAYDDRLVGQQGQASRRDAGPSTA